MFEGRAPGAPVRPDLDDPVRTRNVQGTVRATWSELDWVHVTAATAPQRATLVDLAEVDWLFAAPARPTNAPDAAQDRFATDSATLAGRTIRRPGAHARPRRSMLPEVL